MTDLVAAAEETITAAVIDPRRARERAAELLARAEADNDTEAAAIAHRALALAARELGDIQLAESHLLAAVEAGAGHPLRVAQARMSLVAVRTELGDPQGALRLADLAEPGLTGPDLAALTVQRSITLARLGRYRQAVVRCDAVLAGPYAARDPKIRAMTLLTRGLARTYLEDYHRGAADLAECSAVAKAAGLDHLTTLAEANLSFNAARRGDLPAAFAFHDLAEEALAGCPERLAALRADFAEALVAARRPGEARALLARAVPELAAAGALGHLAEARLLLAHVELLAGDAPLAKATAEAAREDLLAQGRTGWVPLAEEVALRARHRIEGPGPGLLAETLRCVAALEAAGQATAAAVLRLAAARLALDGGDRPAAERELDRLAAACPRAPIRRHAQALRLALRGDTRGALAAVRKGLARVGCARGPVHVRALAARAGEDLAAFGLGLALGTGRAALVFSWAERWRAVVRGEPPAAPRGAARIRAALGEHVLIEFLRQGDDLVAVAVRRDGCVLRPLGSYTAAAETTARLRYGLRRAALGDAADPAPGVDREAALLDAQLLAPLARELGEAPVVVVPTGALHTLPWPVLPTLRGRPVSVAPSAAAWQAMRARGPAAGPAPRVAVVTGPDLRHTADEAAMVLTRHPGAVRVPARSEEVLAALGEADLLHIAAHGIFDSRSPLLSSLLLEDGPLPAFDLLRVERTPRLVVLSACEAGMAHAVADGAPLGLADTFLDRGTRCVIAGVVPIRDAEAPVLMTAFHTLLAAGCGPAAALAAAAERTGVRGFVCFGAG